MKNNHPIIVRFFAPNHPIGCSSVAKSQRLESTDNRPIFQPKSPDDFRTSRGIVRNRQICNAPVVANPVEFLGIWETVHNPDFNSGEFAIIKTQAGLNSYTHIPNQLKGCI